MGSGECGIRSVGTATATLILPLSQRERVLRQRLVDCPQCRVFHARDGGEAIDEAGQTRTAIRLLQLADGLGFDLPDALAGDREDLADFFERVGVAVGQAVAEPQDLALAVVELLRACRRSGS